MGYLKRFYQHIFACLIAIGLMAIGMATAHAGTVSQHVSYDSFWHQEFCDGCTVGAKLELSTSDGWRTADISYVVTGSFPERGDLLNSVSFERMLEAGDHDSDYYTTPRPFDHRIDLRTTSDAAVTASFSGGFYETTTPRPAWDVLAQGLYVSQSYFGSEFHTTAFITFDDRMITSYMFDLWGSSAPPLQVAQTAAFARSFAPLPTAEVPLPAPIFALLGALGLLGWIKRRTA